ncbi:MAG: hypothetical protein AAF330_07130 [Pseudomonadota bacterium]
MSDLAIYDSVAAFLAVGKALIAKGPIAIIIVEDDVEVESTLRHHASVGFKHIIAVTRDPDDIPQGLELPLSIIAFDLTTPGAFVEPINALIDAAPKAWFGYCFNAEYIFFPFCETRTVGEMSVFLMEERRDSALTYVVDLYAGDLRRYPTGVSTPAAQLDKSGYYALSRKDRWNNDIDRQMDFFGGLHWRFEEHIPTKLRRIDRIGIFRAKPGLELLPDHTFSDPEYNTYACPWHHSITGVIASFRTAKALRRNPGSRHQIETFRWHNSVKFSWSSDQLLDLGLMEPGQWF